MGTGCPEAGQGWGVGPQGQDREAAESSIGLGTGSSGAGQGWGPGPQGRMRMGTGSPGAG